MCISVSIQQLSHITTHPHRGNYEMKWTGCFVQTDKHLSVNCLSVYLSVFNVNFCRSCGCFLTPCLAASRIYRWGFSLEFILSCCVSGICDMWWFCAAQRLCISTNITHFRRLFTLWSLKFIYIIFKHSFRTSR